jgi:hypothetical protein
VSHEAPRPRAWVVALTTAGFGVAVFWVIGARGFNWPHNEDFILAEWYRHLVLEHDWSLSQLLATHNLNHPLAFQAAVSTLLFMATGIDFIALIKTTAAMLLLTGAALSLDIGRGLSRPAARAAIVVGVPLLMFHPVQTNHLLWAFEFGWFFITCSMVWNALLIERCGVIGTAIAFLTSVLAAFSSGHGFVLWLTGAAHLALKQTGHARAAVAMFLGAFVLNVAVLSRLAAEPSADIRLSAADAPGFMLYTIQLFGMPFSVRSHRWLLCLGISTIVLAAALVARSWRSGLRHEPTRIGLVLILGSVVEVVAFAIGRYKYGLAWVLSQMHAGPLLVPLLLGMLILAMDTGESTPGRTPLWSATSMLVPVFLVASVISSIPYGLQRAAESQTRAALAMHVSCGDSEQKYLLERLNIGAGFYDMIRGDLPLIRHLCGQAEPERVRRLEELPDDYASMIRKDASFEAPLRDLWQVYLAHFDLQRAFPPDKSTTPARLLEFARYDATSGSLYDPDKLLAHRQFFESYSGN